MTTSLTPMKHWQDEVCPDCKATWVANEPLPARMDHSPSCISVFDNMLLTSKERQQANSIRYATIAVTGCGNTDCHQCYPGPEDD